MQNRKKKNYIKCNCRELKKELLKKIRNGKHERNEYKEIKLISAAIKNNFALRTI
jgi:hypothetical protein